MSVNWITTYKVYMQQPILSLEIFGNLSETDVQKELELSILFQDVHKDMHISLLL